MVILNFWQNFVPGDLLLQDLDIHKYCWATVLRDTIWVASSEASWEKRVSKVRFIIELIHSALCSTFSYFPLSLQLRVSPLFPDKQLNSWMRIGWRLPFKLLFRLWLSWSWPTGYQSLHVSVRAVSQQFNSIKHLYQTSSCSFHVLSLILVYLPSCQ